MYHIGVCAYMLCGLVVCVSYCVCACVVVCDVVIMYVRDVCWCLDICIYVMCIVRYLFLEICCVGMCEVG